MEALTPTVSVILPVRQWRSTTLGAIQSILTQSMPFLELLLIGQQAPQPQFADLPSDPRIRVIPRQRPGIVGALNTGLELARGDYIARMDDDDIAWPERLDRQLDHLRSPGGSELCGGEVRFIDRVGRREGIRLGNRQYESWLNALRSDAEMRDACFIECPLPHPTWMAHRDVWRRLGPYRDDDLPEDYEMVLRARMQGIRLGKPAGIVLDWREHEERLTRNDCRYRRQAFAECRARALVDPRSGLGVCEGRGIWLCGTGRNARLWHDALCRRGVAVRGFVDLHRHGPQRSKRHRPVISYQELARLREDALVITAVAGAAARAELLSWFDARQWRQGHEFILGA